MKLERAGIWVAGTTVSVAVLLLFAAFVSGFVVDTVAVFDTTPGVGGIVSTSVIVADAPFVSVPSVQVTVVVPLQLP